MDLNAVQAGGGELPVLRELLLAIGIPLLLLLLAELARDAAHAQDIARGQSPTGQLSAVPAVLVDGQDRHKLQ